MNLHAEEIRLQFPHLHLTILDEPLKHKQFKYYEYFMDKTDVRVLREIPLEHYVSQYYIKFTLNMMGGVGSIVTPFDS